MKAIYNYLNPTVFRERLKHAIADGGMTAEQVAIECEIPLSSMRNYTGITTFSAPRLDVLVGIADTLNVSLDYLCGRKESKEI